MSPKKLFLSLLAAAALVGGTCFYLLYFIKSPAYAVKEVVQAVREHDVERFQRHVDVPVVIDKSFDDIIIAESTINNDSVASNPFALGILHMLKPAVVNLLTEEALKEVGRKPEAAAADKEEPRDPVTDAMKDNLKRKIFYDKLRIKDFSLAQDNGDAASVNLVVRNSELNKDFTLILSMQKNKDEIWQIREISNLADVIIEMEAAHKAHLAELNASALERIDKVLSITEAQVKLSKEDAAAAGKTALSRKNEAIVPEEHGPQYTLTTKAAVYNNSGKTINRIHYDVLLLDKDKQTVYNYPGNFNGRIAPQTGRQLQTKKWLNLLIPADKQLIQLKVSELTVKLQPSYISFDDGSVLEPNNYLQ